MSRATVEQELIKETKQVKNLEEIKKLQLKVLQKIYI